MFDESEGRFAVLREVRAYARRSAVAFMRGEVKVPVESLTEFMNGSGR